MYLLNLKNSLPNSNIWEYFYNEEEQKTIVWATMQNVEEVSFLMSVYLIQDTTLTEIANNIRAKTNETNLITPSEMASKIASISSESYNIEVTVEKGALVTITNGVDIYTGTSTGICNFTVQKEGDWTCSATLNGNQSDTKIINVFNDFSTTLSFFKATVMINTSEGATVTASKGNIIFTQAAPSTGVVSFVIQEPGEWTFKAEKDGLSSSKTISIIEGKTYDIFLPIASLTLNSNSWKTISEISQAGMAKNYWSIGDCKSVYLNGTMGILALNTTLWLYILGFDHNAESEGYGITFGGFKTDSGSSGIDICLIDSEYSNQLDDGTKCFNMNHWGRYNYGGWARSDVRYDILGSTDVAPQNYGRRAASGEVGYNATTTCATSPVANTLMSCLPADLRAVMKPIIKWTDNIGGSGNTEEKVTAMIDYLPLLAEFEIFGTRTKANSFEQNHQAQYEYYSTGNRKGKYKHSGTSSAAYWWERSPLYDSTVGFCRVNTNGSAYSAIAYVTCGIAPILLV